LLLLAVPAAGLAQDGVTVELSSQPDKVPAGEQWKVTLTIRQTGRAPRSDLKPTIEVRDADGFTALHHAAARGDNEMIMYLVGKGADVMVVNRRGQTTVDMANSPEQRTQPFPETIKLLEGMGAKNNHNCRACG